MADKHPCVRVTEKLNLILLVISVMALAGFLTQGFYSSHTTNELPYAVGLSFSNPSGQQFHCNINGNDTEYWNVFTASYIQNDVVVCNVCPLAITLELPLEVQFGEGFHSPAPVTINPGFNYIQLYGNFVQDDDDESSSEIESMTIVNSMLPSTENCTVQFGPAVVSINVWGASTSLIAICVIVFLATSLVVIFGFVQWYLEWKQGSDYQTV